MAFQAQMGQSGRRFRIPVLTSQQGKGKGQNNNFVLVNPPSFLGQNIALLPVAIGETGHH